MNALTKWMLAGTAAVMTLSATAAFAEPVLGLAAIDLQNSFFVRMKEAGDVAAKDYKVKTVWQSAEGSLEKQVGIVENFINQKVSAILVDPLDKTALIPVIKKAEDAGIPVVTMGNKVEAGQYSTLYPDYVNMTTVAKALGLKMGGKGQAGLLIGSRGNYVSDTRERAFTDVMKKEFPDIQVVGIEPTNWDAGKATNAAQTLIPRPALVRACNSWRPIRTNCAFAVSIKCRFSRKPVRSAQVLGRMFLRVAATR